MNLDYRSIPYRIFENGLRIVGVAVFSFVFSSGGSGGGSFDPLQLGTLLLFGLFLVAGWEFAYVKRYEYRVTRDTFDIRSGVFSRREREIPFGRIQNVDIAQNVVQRLIGIAELRLETAGGGDSEARLRYVSRPEANRLQELISDRKRDETDREETGSEDVLFELDSRELVVLGLTSANLRFVGLFAVLVSVVGSPVAASQISPRAGLLLVLGPAFAAAGLVLLWLASGIQAVLRYYGFRLVSHDEELRYQRGLLQQYNGTIPLSKIQTLMIRENLLARTAGYGNLVIETAGYAPGQGENVESAVPIARRERLFELARRIEDVGEISFTRPPGRARTRYLARYTILVGAFTAALALVHLVTESLPLWYLGAATWILVLPAAHLKWTHLGYYYDDGYVVTRSGFWTRKTTIVPYYRIQTLADTQTIFQRRRDLGTLVVDTASSGGLWGGDAIAKDIDSDTAATLREEFHDRFRTALAQRRASERSRSDQNSVSSPSKTNTNQ